MPAPGHLGPAPDVGEYPGRGAARRLEDLARKLRIAGRYRDGLAGRQDRRAVKPRIIRPERRPDRAGKPVERDVGEHAVAGNRALDIAAAIRPRTEFLDDPCRKAN